MKIVPVLSILLLGAPLAGCRKDRADAGNKTGAAGSTDAVKQSLEALKAPLNALNTKFADLHKQFDPLPPNLPGIEEVRGKFYATDEGLGRIVAKIDWLAHRLEAARKSGNRQELDEVSKDIAQTQEELRQIDRIALELVHQVLPFQKMMADIKAQEAAAASAPPFTRSLPTGYAVKGAQGGLEQRLLEFIDDPARKVDKTTWFDFDRVYFAGGGPGLDSPASRAQLENVHEILKAYPAVKLQLDVYTEQPGAAAEARKRAQAVKKYFVTLGISGSRIDADGVAKQPVSPASDKDECATKNGRGAVRVTAK